MRLEFTGKHRTKVEGIKPYEEKMGQTESRTGAAISFSMVLPNTILNQFDKNLREFWFKKASAPARQAIIEEGTTGPLVQDLVEITQAGNRMGRTFSWDDDMTGATLRVHHGISDKPKIDLIGCKVDSVKFKCIDGAGAVELFFRVIAYGIDEETAGELFLLHKQQIDIELQPPSVDGQKHLPPPDAGEKPPQTPVEALKKAVKSATAKPANAPAKSKAVEIGKDHKCACGRFIKPLGLASHRKNCSAYKERANA